MGAPFEITTSDEAVFLANPPAPQRVITRAELSAVMVETHVSGHLVTDVWWLLYGRPDEPAVRVPQGSPGEEGLVQWLMLLPGFDIDTLAHAMRFRGNETFQLWRASAAPL